MYLLGRIVGCIPYILMGVQLAILFSQFEHAAKNAVHESANKNDQIVLANMGAIQHIG